MTLGNLLYKHKARALTVIQWLVVLFCNICISRYFLYYIDDSLFCDLPYFYTPEGLKSTDRVNIYIMYKVYQYIINTNTNNFLKSLAVGAVHGKPSYVVLLSAAGL